MQYNNEKILAKCNLLGQGDKKKECILTPTKLYFTRRNIVEFRSLKDISGVRIERVVNWNLIALGVIVLLLAAINYFVGLYPAKPNVGLGITKGATFLCQNQESEGGVKLKGLKQQEPIKLKGLKVQQGVNTDQVDSDDVLKPLDQVMPQEEGYVLPPLQDLRSEAAWEEEKNNVSMGVAILGCVLVFLGIKWKRSYLTLITNQGVISLRTGLATEEYNHFVNVLSSRIGITVTE